MSVTIELNEALQAIKTLAINKRHVGTKKININKYPYAALSQILSSNIYAPFDLPRAALSAMDGYAVFDILDSYKIETNINNLSKNSAFYVSTGAPLPKGTISVIKIEDANKDSEGSINPKNIIINANIRCKGEDVKKNDLIATKGKKINMGLIALFNALGIQHICVEKREKINICIFSSGNEITELGNKLSTNSFYNINANLTNMFLQSSFNIKAKYLGILKDNFKENKEILSKMIKKKSPPDIILISGGSSVGKLDYTKKIIKDLGAKIIFDGINMKPGKPVMLAIYKSTCIINLAGNPKAALANCIALLPTLFNTINKYYSLPTIMAKNTKSFNISKDKSHVIFGFYDGNFFTPLIENTGNLKEFKEMNSCAIFLSSHYCDCIKEGDIRNIKEGKILKIICH